MEELREQGGLDSWNGGMMVVKVRSEMGKDLAPLEANNYLVSFLCQPQQVIGCSSQYHCPRCKSFVPWSLRHLGGRLGDFSNYCC